MGIEGEEIQTKGIDNLFNKLIAENFPNLEKERDIQVQEAYRTPNHQDQKRNTPKHIIIKDTEQRKNIETFKREKNKSHIKANPS
jgi:hypothetical protein